MATGSYSVEQHVQLIKLYYQNGCSLVATMRALRPFYGVHGRPSKSTIQRSVAKFEATGSVNNQSKLIRQRNARSVKNIAAVCESVLQNPRQSIPRRSQEIGLSQTTTWRILRSDLGQLTQELKPNDDTQFRVIMNPNPMAELMYCVQFAARKHKDQRRKDPKKTPYINHPINVATILAFEANIDDKEVLQAALLHDTVEDTETTFEEIEEAFGKNVADIVREVTDDKSLPKLERKELQIEHAKTSSEKAKLVKLADKLDNLRDLQNVLPDGWTQQRGEEYFVWAKKVVDNLRGTNQIMESELDEIFRQKNLLQ